MEINKDREGWIRSRREDPGDFPRVLLIDTCSYCNFKCSMCFHKDMKREKGIMPWSLYTKIIDEVAMKNKDIRVWLIYFGEPFIIRDINLDNNIFRMIRYAKSKGLTDVVLNSNGNLMDKATARNIINSDLDAIYFGVDAASVDVYKKYRVGGDYHKVVANILYLVKLKKEMGKTHPDIFIQFVEMNGNRQEKEDFIEFWSDYDVTVKIRPMLTWINKLPQQKHPPTSRYPCYWNMQVMAITDKGIVAYCANDMDADVPCGDINKQTIQEAWKGMRLYRVLQQSEMWNNLPEMCRNCVDWQAGTCEYIDV